MDVLPVPLPAPSYGMSRSSYFCPRPAPKKCHAEHRGRSRSDQLGVEGNSRLPRQLSRLNDLRFSLKPYKWIRYATGIVIGVRGELCTERDLPNPVPINYDSGLSVVSIDLYYHTTNQEKRLIFPIDPKLADTRTETSSGTSSRREDFRDEVENRDEVCVVTGVPGFLCDAAHILPHSNGDKV